MDTLGEGVFGMKNGRGGQATPISVVILMAATIVIGLAMFAFFTGIARETSLQQGITNVVHSASVGVNPTIVLRESDESQAPAVYCITVSLTNISGSQLRLGVTLLPFVKLGGNLYPDDLVSIYPVHSDTDPANPQAGLNLRLFYLEDIDGDGLVNLVGNAGLDLGEAVPSCRTIYNESSYWNSYVEPTIYAAWSDVRLPEGFSLEDILRGSGLQYFPRVPLWIDTLEPGESKTIKLVVATYDFDNPTAIIPLDTAALTITVQVDRYQYIALMVPVQAG